MTNLTGDSEILQRDLRAPTLLPRRSRSRFGVVAPWYFIVPALVIYLFIEVIPSFQGVLYSFTDWDGFSRDLGFVGTANYARVFESGPAGEAFRNTFLLALGVTLIQNTVGLLLALGLNSKLVRSRNLLRVIFFTPVVLTPLVTGYIWNYLLTPQGTVNSFLDAIGLDALTRTWLGDPSTALAAVGVAIIWQFSGYSMVIYLAGLQAIPQELYESSALDGASALQRFWYVVRPLLNGAFVINFVLTLIGSLGQFDHVMAMTGGGPGNSTQTISTVIYQQGVVQSQYGYAVAMSVLMTGMVAVLAVVQYRVIQRRVS